MPREPVRLAFESPLNLIVVEAWIQQEGPFRFLLDSGATGSVVDAALARRLGLPTGSANTRRGTAAGSQVTAASVQGGVDFLLAPGFEVHVGNVITAPFSEVGMVMLGEHFDGILGSAIFHQFVVEVDYADRFVVLHDPSRYRYDGEGNELELHFPDARTNLSSLPFLRATLENDGRRLSDFLILVDSGGQTMGMASVAERSEWDRLVGPDTHVVEALGATGLSNDAEGTTHDAFTAAMDRLILGPFEFEEPLVGYSAGGPSVAVLGAALLHRFTAIFDYSRERLILEPNEVFERAAMVDQSGLFLTLSADAETFEVWFVADGTPAHEAGLVKRDIIRSIDGVPAREIRLNEARAMLSLTKNRRLLVERDGRTLPIELSTRPLYVRGP